jgi:ABC-type glycerol-3-phosphate transport system substrate-binding protein
MSKRLSLVLFLIGVLALSIAPMVGAQDEVRIVSFMTTFGGSELDALNQSLNAFTEQTGIQVIVESNRQLVPILRTRIAGGSPPDVALIPQPGLVAEFARGGSILPLVNADGSDGLISQALLDENYAAGIQALGTVDGAVYGILAKANSKSTMWYKPPQFAELGIEIPTTWEELMAVQQTLIDNGITPWSIGGGESGGWPLTDWFENIYARVAGPEMYNQLFVTHEIPWTDPSVVEAMGYFGQIVNPPDTHLAGGADGTLATDFITAANLVFRPDNPEAAMYFEGGFMGGIIASNFPELTPVEDFSAFMFPSINADYGYPVVGGGDLLVAFSDRPEVAELIQWMAGAEGNSLWAATGAIVSPNQNVGMDVYSPLAALDAGQVAGAETFVFDGSDLTPSAVSQAMGEMLQGYIANPDDLDSLLQSVEDVAATSY